MGNSVLLGMAAVYASQVGMSVSRTALFAGAAAVGAVVLQWPIGYLSDYIGRRPMILIVSSVAVVIAVIGTGLSPEGWPILAAMFLFGGMSYPMYSLALSHVIDVLPAGRAVTASSTNVFLTGVGAIFGPLVAAGLMTAIGPSGFWWTLVIAFGAIAAFALFRVIRSPRIEGLSPEPYLAVPARSTGIVRLVRRTAGQDARERGPQTND
jgi:MFS family permease